MQTSSDNLQAQQTIPNPGSAGDPEPAEPLFVLTCLVAPVLWGIVVHRVFRHLRGRQRSTSDDADSVWPDYQI
ncbi:MAG: hypothetical protein RIK87_25340 [Fuerstiella sp.]